MEEIDFKDWLESNVTVYFLKYLQDSAKEESKLVAQTIVNGDVVPLDDQLRISTIAITLNQISEITFAEIEDFYER